MSQLAFDFETKTGLIDNTWTHICDYCGRDWGNRFLYDINCHYDTNPTYNGMCGTEFWIQRRAENIARLGTKKA